MRTNPFSSPAAVVVASALALAGSLTVRAASPGAAQTVPRDPARAAHMQAHFGEVMTIHEAVIRGDLAAVKRPATWLADHEAPASMPAGAAPYFAEFRRAARRTAQATTVRDAALGTADLLKTCGDCHRGLGTMPAVAESSRPEVGGLVGHMLGHQESIDRMVQGLVVPSTTAWRAGAEGLSGDALRHQALPDDPKLTSAIAASEKRIHELAAQAGTSDSPDARAALYGQIIGRCADCHGLHRQVWGPARR